MKKQLALISLFLTLCFNLALAQTVYVTNTGEKYYSEGCRYLRKSKIAMDLGEAINKGYTACKVCSASRGTPEPRQENKAASSEQCTEQTKSGSRCKRMTKSPNGRCWQHGGD